MPETPIPPLRVLITAGPTHEPIDRVRYLGNRSSGRMGVAIAAAAARRGHVTTLLLGPVPLDSPDPTQIHTERFRTADELATLLKEHWPSHDVLIMAAAVADFRPARGTTASKIRRSDAGLTLHLEATPDLLVGLADLTRPDQFVVGFALEDETGLREAALEKLRRKHLDAIVANPLETMDAEAVRAVVLTRSGDLLDPGGTLSKTDFAVWLLDRIEELHVLATSAEGDGIG